MRFHKAVEVTKAQARKITGSRTTALSEWVVISQGQRYYDVRAMTEAEVKAFVDDLAREEFAALQKAASLPN